MTGMGPRSLVRKSCAALLAVTVVASPSGGATARSWGSPGRGGGWDSPQSFPAREAGPAEGVVTVSRFMAEGDASKALQSGPIVVTGAPVGSGLPSVELAVYEAAVVDQLAQVGYQTDKPSAPAGQVAEVRVSRETLAPAERKKPVSGTMALGVSNRGTAYGFGVNVDLTKPRPALITTRLEARIRDKATGTVLWEARADVNTREGDDLWPESKVAARLAAALFSHFPGTSGETFTDSRAFERVRSRER